MTSLSRRLQRLEATTARLDPSERRREFEEFGRAAEEYMRAVHRYLGEPPDGKMTVTCRNESEMSQVVNQVAAYRVRSLRHYYHHRGSVGECWIGNAPPERRVRSVAGDNDDD
jgi:thioesterase domain-containing protein